MRDLRLTALIVAAAIAALGAASWVGAATAAPSATPRNAQAKVASMFARYRLALLGRDFAAACRLTAPETDARLISNLGVAGVFVNDCVEALTWIYDGKRDGGRTPKLADSITRTTKVSKITIKGATATIVWSAELDGRRVSVSNKARIVDGTWQLVDTR